LAFESDPIISLYQRHAIDWDRERGRRLFEKAWLDQFLALLPPNPTILDMGCGSGEPIAGYLIVKGCDLTGVDASSAMIGMCKDRFPDQEWFVADVRTLSLERRFDGILAWDSFFTYPRKTNAGCSRSSAGIQDRRQL
jgi:trans-aconitate methyltransferase